MKYIYKIFLILGFVITIFLIYISFSFVSSSNGKYPVNFFGTYLFSDSGNLYITFGNKNNVSIGDLILCKNVDVSPDKIDEYTVILNIYSITRNDNAIQVQVSVNNVNKVLPLEYIYGMVRNTGYSSGFFDFCLRYSYFIFSFVLLFFIVFIYLMFKCFKKPKVVDIDVYKELSLIKPKVDKIKYNVNYLRIKKQIDVAADVCWLEETNVVNTDTDKAEKLNDKVINLTTCIYEFLGDDYLKDKEVVSIYSDSYNIDDYKDDISEIFNNRDNETSNSFYDYFNALNDSLLKKERNSDSFELSLLLKFYSQSNNIKNFDCYDCFENPYISVDNLDYQHTKNSKI